MGGILRASKTRTSADRSRRSRNSESDDRRESSPARISGAQYTAVPTIVMDSASLPLKRRDSPKSATFARTSCVMSTLSGLRSRWIKGVDRSWWRYFMHCAMPNAKLWRGSAQLPQSSAFR